MTVLINQCRSLVISPPMSLVPCGTCMCITHHCILLLNETLIYIIKHLEWWTKFRTVWLYNTNFLLEFKSTLSSLFPRKFRPGRISCWVKFTCWLICSSFPLASPGNVVARLIRLLKDRKLCGAMCPPIICQTLKADFPFLVYTAIHPSVVSLPSFLLFSWN